MLEGLAAWVLNTYIGEYVENLNTAQLSIALLQGAVELENLPLKKDALKYIDLPLEVKSGFIGKITLQIPIRHLRSEPWVISIEKLYLVAGPFKHTNFDAEKNKKDEQAKKVAMLEALEKEWKIQKQEKQEGYGSSWFSYGTSIASNILENIQLKIKDVHIRYEDDKLIPSCPFAFGINIRSLSAVSTNGQWEVKFVSHDESDMMHKLIDLQNFSVYLDTNATMLGNLSMSDLSDALQREMFVSSRTNKFQDHEFILEPISAQTKLKRNTSALPLRSPHMPRIELNMNLDDINVCLSEVQYRCIIQWLKEIERHDKRRKCKMSCPTTSVTKCPKDWWKYAIAVNRNRIREKNEHCTWNFATKRVKDVLRYYKAYTICLIGEQLNTKMMADKNRIEEEFSFEELRIIRDLAYRKVKEQGSLFKITPQEKPQPEVQQTGYLQSWFPGWGGWGGSVSQTPTQSSSGTNVDSDVGEPPPVKAEQEQDLEQEIMEVIQETSENTSFLKKDVVFALMNFTLNSGSFKLLCPKPSSAMSFGEQPSNVTMVEVECSLINMMFESRPRTSAMKYRLSLGSIHLRDKFTENSSFPCLISPQTRERALSFSGSFSSMDSPRRSRSSGEQNEPKADFPHHSKSLDSFFRMAQEEKLFELMYEKNPSSPDAAYRLSIITKPLDLVYNPSTVRRVREFFSSRNKEMARVSKLELTAHARRRYEVFKEQTKAELKNTLDQILAGDESIKMKKWVVDLDISAPQILIPENFVESNGRMVVLDLGHLHLYNKNSKQRQDSGGDEEDEFQTPLSTPPSEAEPTEVPSLTQLSETEIYDKLYDRYTLELSDLQVMVGRAKDNWKLARNRGLSHLHVIDKFTISLQFEKRLVHTTDPQYPSTTMNATLPSLNIHVNEHKVTALRNCIDVILQPSSGIADLSASSSSMSFNDTIEQDKTSPKLTQDKGFKIGDKLRDLDEFTKLMVAQFSINSVSLEIHSRGRPIAELQVTKVKANMTKRPYDTSVGLTVHSLLVVDALQTYGHDFELLIASHRGVRLDSKSGSIMGSDPASPTSPTSPLSPRSPAEMACPTPTTSLQTVQDAISKAFKVFVTGDTPEPRSHIEVSRSSSYPIDTEAIIKLDLEIIERNSPSNGNDSELKIANLQFSNLDIVANQETMVELLSFMKQIAPKDEDKSQQNSSSSLQNASQLSLNTTFAQKADREITSKLEVTADFQRLNILLMRLEDSRGMKQARKVATFTMSSAQLQATVANELDVSGSIGGFHLLDVTPDAGKYFHTFSVGSEEVLGAHQDSFHHSVMYKTAHESLFVSEHGTKALQFNFMRGVQPSSTLQDFSIDTSRMSDNSTPKLTNVSLQMASMCYIHSPRLLNEVTQCVSEFTDFMKRVGDSIKSAASEMAKGIMTKKADLSMFGSTTGLEFTRSNLSINSNDEMTECRGGSHILLNAQLDTPVIVIPRTSDSPDVLVAHLGHISVKNFDSLSQDLEESQKSNCSVRIFIEAKDMNLYSLNIDKHMEQHPSSIPGNMFDTSIYRNSDFGLPIVHNTTVEILLEHIQPEPLVINLSDMEELLTSETGSASPSCTIDVSACIATPLNIELCKSVYEQVLQTTDNLTYNENVHGKLTKTTEQSQKLGNDSNVEELLDKTPKKVEFKIPEEKKKEETVIKVNFKVPTINVEMKGEFDKGYKGLVNLNLQDFVLDMKKENSYSTEIEVQLKSLVMEDLLEKEDSEHRYLMISRQCKEERPPEPKLFLSQSCPDSCIVAPIPVMPHSLPSSFHKDFSHPEFELPWEQPFRKPIGNRPRNGKTEKKGPSTPPPTRKYPRRDSDDNPKEEDLVNIKVVLIDKFSPEYVKKYNKTNRFIDVDFNSLDANVNQQTWVVLLDFLGLGAKIHDEDSLSSENSSVMEKDLPKSEEPSVNSVVNLKVKSFSLRLNKPEYELSRAQMSKFSAHIETRDGNLKVTGQLGSISLTDQSPHGDLFRERFITVGKQALVFDIFKYGLPDPGLQREYDIKVNLKMASVRYVHTNRFQLEFVAFLQHFLQLQDVLGRMRAASAGKKVADKASRSSRISLDIEANSPIIVIPHSSKSNDVLIVDLGNLTVKNVFKHDGDKGTLSAVYRPVVPESAGVPRTESSDSLLSKNSEASIGCLMTESIYNDLLPPTSASDDPMTSSIYGSLEKDCRFGDDDDFDNGDLFINDPTILKSPTGSSVDPNFLLDSSSSGSSEFVKRNARKTDSETSSRDLNFPGKRGPVDNFLKVNSDGSVSSEGPDYICLLDVMSVILSDMDLYSAERVDKYEYNKDSDQASEKDLVFTDCVMRRQGGNSLKEKCKLELQIERNLENDISHAVPEFRINGELSSIHITIDINQFKLIRGILDHNLGEKLPEFQKPLMSNLMDPKIHTVLSGTVWQNIGMSIDLNNVTIELVLSHYQGPEFPECSLAKLDFISSTFRFDSFSNQSKDVDLVSHEIVASDTRYRDAPVNVRPNVFEKILQPGPSKNRKFHYSEYGSFQLELHFRSTKDSNQFSILLNNMKLMCIFDWLLTVQEFLTSKPDDPFNQDGDIASGVGVNIDNIPLSPRPGSRTCSPVNMSSGVMTKRGPIIEQVEVPFELKLNVSDTQFVVVEDTTTWDTNAVILKSTAVLTYRPNCQDKLLICHLQSVEVFSCSLLSEDETALSIIDPLQINIELNANPLPNPKKSDSCGFNEASDLKQRNLLLEVTFHTMNIRLSYLDMKMFLAILNSLPDQALKAKNRESQTFPSKYPSNTIKVLRDLGFSDEECEKALDSSKGDQNEAAIWLTQHGKPMPVQKKEGGLNLTCIELRATCLCLCFIDDCKDSDVPLAELSFSSIHVKQTLQTVVEGVARFNLTGDYYNRELSGWEPFIEPWKCITEWLKFEEKDNKKQDIHINAPDVLNINITRTLLDLYNKTKDKWTEDYYKQASPANSPREGNLIMSASEGTVSNQRRRTPFVPFVLDNQTGCPLWYLKVTTHPSRIKLESDSKQDVMDWGFIQTSDWKNVRPGQQVSFEFSRPQKIRHKKSHDLHVNQIVVKIDGWNRLSAVSVDKVGVYFRVAEPDKKSDTGLNSISFGSWHDPAKQHLARVVFDVRQEGSAKKVITIRSALTISNKISSPLDVRMLAGNGLEGKFEILQIKPRETLPVPLPFICATLYMRPSDWPVKFCDQPIQWQHVGLPGDDHIKEKILKCEMPDDSGNYRFCSSVCRENYPEQILTSEDIPILPGHMITILPPVIIHNLLPIDMRYYLKGTEICGIIKPGKKADLHAANPLQDMTLGINLENFEKCHELLIPPNTNRDGVKLRLIDSKGRKLLLTIKISCRKGGCVNISVLSPFWLINRTGLPLVFGQTEKESAGQFDEHELARCVAPLLFSFTDHDATEIIYTQKKYRCTMRIGKAVHGPNSLPLWCSKFSLDSGVGVRKLNVVRREGNKPDWVYNIGIAVQQGRGKYKCTKIVNFAPRFEIDNQSSHKLAIAQRHIAMEELMGNVDTYLTALPDGKMPFHFPRLDFDQLLCVKMINKPECMWSGGFLIDKVNSFHINMRDKLGNSYLLKVEIVLEGPTYHIIFVDAEEFPPPFRIDNHSEVPVFYYQTGLTQPYQKASVKPRTSLPFAWDEPTLEPQLTLYVQGGSKVTYNLDKLEEGEQLCYENFIYLAASGTFGNESSDDIYTDLVLEVVHGNNVVFKKKAIGNRAQLWRMTGSGMLEHEGSAVPRDPRKPSSTTNSLVLDTSVIAPQPRECSPLTLRKPDRRRTATQIWEFTEDGRLCCASGILCVQALGGILQEGAIAISGPGPAKPEHRVEKHMQICRQKLRPGSGYLSVRVLMDGPIRVLEIADIQSEHHQRPTMKEESGWQIYEEKSTISRELEKAKQGERKVVKLQMNLKGGLGISLINRIPEELVYITLSNIAVEYQSSPEKILFDISVGDIQVDNQLLDAQRPVLLFVTRNPKKEGPDYQNKALNIVAHKVPNTKWNADIYKHLVISMKKMTLDIEEKLLWKLFQFAGFGKEEHLADETDYDSQKSLAAVSSVKAKRYYFGTLKVNTKRVVMSMNTSKLPPDLRAIKLTMTSGILASFEDAQVDLDSFVRNHPFETADFLTREIIQHFTGEIKSQAAKLLGSVDFLGNPLGLFNDVAEGITGLIKDGNLGGLMKNVTHGLSNTAAKVTGSLSDNVGILNFDERHNDRREEIKNYGSTSRGGHLMAGIWGLGHGLWGGISSIPRTSIEGAKEEGLGGAVVGFVKGVGGVVPKVATGVLDLASGAANAIKDHSHSRYTPKRVRESRWCKGPGGLLPSYGKKHADHQRFLFKLNKYDTFIAMESLRTAKDDGCIALITDQQLIFLRPGSPSEDNIIFQAPYNKLKHCRIFESNKRHYVELLLSKKERPVQVLCDKQYIAQKVSQQINYARNLYDEQLHTVKEYTSADSMD